MSKKLLITEEGRDCGSCKDFKLWEEYSVNKSSKTGHQSCCKECSKKRATNHKYVKQEEKRATSGKGFSQSMQNFCLSK